MRSYGFWNMWGLDQAAKWAAYFVLCIYVRKKINGSEDEEIGGLHVDIYAEANSSIGLVSEMA